MVSQPVAPAAPVRNPDDLLCRDLGVRQLAAAIFNYTIGSGIFVLPALVAVQLGSAAVIAYLLRRDHGTRGSLLRRGGKPGVRVGRYLRLRRGRAGSAARVPGG